MDKVERESLISRYYLNLKGLVVDRKDQFDACMNFLEAETDWLSAPASTKYHCSYESGLLEHSVNVANTLLRLKKILNPSLSDESCVIVGLLHDCGKTGEYIIKEPTPRQIEFGYPGSIVYNDQRPWMDHEIRSLMIISRFITLDEYEWAAIAYHNQPWNNQTSAFRKNSLMTLLQNADYYSTVYYEEGGSR